MSRVCRQSPVGRLDSLLIMRIIDFQFTIATKCPSLPNHSRQDMLVGSVFFAESLHDGDGTDGILDLSQLKLELLDVFLHVGEDDGRDFSSHPLVVDDVCCSNPLLIINGQQLPH